MVPLTPVIWIQLPIVAPPVDSRIRDVVAAEVVMTLPTTPTLKEPADDVATLIEPVETAVELAVPATSRVVSGVEVPMPTRPEMGSIANTFEPKMTPGPLVPELVKVTVVVEVLA